MANWPETMTASPSNIQFGTRTYGDVEQAQADADRHEIILVATLRKGMNRLEEFKALPADAKALFLQLLMEPTDRPLLSIFADWLEDQMNNELMAHIRRLADVRKTPVHQDSPPYTVRKTLLYRDLPPSADSSGT